MQVTASLTKTTSASKNNNTVWSVNRVLRLIRRTACHELWKLLWASLFIAFSQWASVYFGSLVVLNVDVFVSTTAFQVKILLLLRFSKCRPRHPELVVIRKELVVVRKSQQKATTTTHCDMKKKASPRERSTSKRKEQKSQTNNPR